MRVCRTWDRGCTSHRPLSIQFLWEWSAQLCCMCIWKKKNLSLFVTTYCSSTVYRFSYYGTFLFFIGPESDHCLPLSLTHWLTNWLTDSCLVNLIDVTLACEDANSKLVDVVTIADDDRVGNNLLQIWTLRFGQKAKLLFRHWAQGLVKVLMLKFRQDF